MPPGCADIVFWWFLDLVISDQQVSSEHLIINNGVLVDPKSTNGTFINDSPDVVRPAPAGRSPVAGRRSPVRQLATVNLMLTVIGYGFMFV